MIGFVDRPYAITSAEDRERASAMLPDGFVARGADGLPMGGEHLGGNRGPALHPRISGG